jgi:hypothetical protein
VGGMNDVQDMCCALGDHAGADARLTRQAAFGAGGAMMTRCREASCAFAPLILLAFCSLATWSRLALLLALVLPHMRRIIGVWRLIYSVLAVIDLRHMPGMLQSDLHPLSSTYVEVSVWIPG